MDWKLIIVDRAVKWLVGGDLLTFIKDAVLKINDESISGDEKRQAVQDGAKRLFSDVGVIFINLAIEIAVILLRAQLNKEA